MDRKKCNVLFNGIYWNLLEIEDIFCLIREKAMLTKQQSLEGWSMV